MKKLTALFVLALFVAGMIPAAFAATAGGSDEAGGDLTATDAAEIRAEEIAQGTATERAGAGPKENAMKRIKEVRDKAVENRKRLIAAKDNLLEKRQEMVANLVERCKKTGKTEEECKAAFEQRLQNIAELAPKFREKLRQFEERRAERGKELQELKNDKLLGNIDRAKEFKARIFKEGNIEKLQKNFEKAKEKFMEAKAGLDRARIRLDEAKASRVCKENPDSEECAKARNETRMAAKERLTREAGIVITSLEKAKEKVLSSEYISDEEEKLATEFLDAQIAKFTVIKEGIGNAQTKEEIVAASKKLADAWKEVKHKVNAYMEFIGNARMAGIVVKAEHLSAKLERVLERMAENQKDTTAVEPLVAGFKAKTDLAKEKFRSASSLLLEARTSDTLTEEQKKAKVDEAKALIEESKRALKDANEALRDIFEKIKEVGATKELEDANAADDVETEEEVAETSAETAVTA